MQRRPDNQREWSIQELSRTAGVTSRTLRHYDDVGVLAPTRTGRNGMRFYDSGALVRLQRILLLRDLGLGLPAIREALDGRHNTAGALRTHLELLEHERTQLERRIRAVRTTLEKTEKGEALMANEVFDGFDHTQYRDEVTERWGEQAYATGDRWWRGMSDRERGDWKSQVDTLNADWVAAAQAGLDPHGERAQALARRHVEWLTSVPGTPAHGADASHRPVDDNLRGYVLGLADMYVEDDRFGANYGGTAGAEFVRAALQHYLGLP